MKFLNFQRYQIRLLELCLVLVLAWVVSVGLFGEAVTKDQAVVSSGLLQNAIKLDMKALLSTDLFGEKKAEVVTKKSAPVVAVVKSRLKIKLLGTVVAGKRSAAVVLLNGSAKQQVFFIGESLQTGTILKEVEENAIVIDHQGSLERIVLVRDKSIAGASIKGFVKHERHRLKRSYINRSVKNFPKLLSQARVVPHFKDGHADGFIILEIEKGSLYQNIGLKNGDLIHKVNGKVINSAAQAMGLYQDLQNASAIDLELVRAGSVLPIHYEIQ